MNKKIFYIVGALLAGYALPSGLQAQNLILDGGFDSGMLVKADMLKGATAFGVWAGVTGESGWALVEAGSNRVLSACGKGVPRKSASGRGKPVFQEITQKSVLPGTYTLQFKCQGDRKLLKSSHMTVTVAQRTVQQGAPGMAETAESIESSQDRTIKGYQVLLDGPLLASQQTDVAGPDEWKNVEFSFEVADADKSLLLVFSGMADTGSFRVDDVSLTRTGGITTPPRKSNVSSASVVNFFEKPSTDAVAKSAPAPAAAPRPVPAPVTLTAAPPARPVLNPVRPPVENLILNGDFSAASLALPTAAGDTTAELSGRWLRSVAAAWEISPSGGNLGPYVRAAASRQESRLLYVVSDAKRSTGSYVLRFDYVLTDLTDVLGVKVFVSDRDITVGTDGGDFRMNSLQRPSDMLMLPSSGSWSTYNVPVELGDGYDYIYVLFTGSGAGNTGIDNVSLSPRRR